MYDVKMSSQKRKDDIILNLNRAILRCDSIPCPNKFLSDTSSRSVPGGDVSGPSGYVTQPPSLTPVNVPFGSLASRLPFTIQTERQSRNRKGKGKGKGSAKRRTPAATMYDSDENCVVCNRNYVDIEDWISCDTCYLWYHR